MQIFLFLAFIAVPIIEIALFIKAGQLIGVLPTIALIIGTAIAGSFLMRVQGFAVLNRFTEAAAKGEMPLVPVIDGIGILVAGLLLMTPGFFTDILGIMLFIPPARRAAMRWLFTKALAGGRVHVRRYGASGPGAGPRADPRPETQPGAGRPPRQGGPGFRKADDVIDAEFETIEPDEAAKQPGTGAKKSPWGRKD
jgi:UPF0716 protein FxsA